MGVLCEVGFFGLLRPREILNLKVGDLAFPSNLLSVAANYCIAKIVNPKNRRQLGKVQFAVIRSERATEWLRWLVEGLAGFEKVWPSTDTEFRNRFKQLMAALGLKDWKLLPSSLRPGGASWYFVGGVEPGRLKFWGRWASERSLGHYIQESMAYLLNQLASSEAHNKISHILGERAFLEIPQCGWWKFAKRGNQGLTLSQQFRNQSSTAIVAQRDLEALYPMPK